MYSVTLIQYSVSSNIVDRNIDLFPTVKNSSRREIQSFDRQPEAKDKWCEWLSEHDSPCMESNPADPFAGIEPDGFLATEIELKLNRIS